MKKLTFLFVIFMCLCCTSANAQKRKHQFGLKGEWELGGTIFYSSTTPVVNDSTGNATNVFQIQPVIGYFVTKGVEIGIQPTLTFVSSNGYSYNTMALYFAPAYNFIMKGKIYPAIVALIGYTSTSTTPTTGPSYSASGFSWGGEAGVKMNLAGNSLLFAGLQYLRVTNNPSGSTSRNGQNVLSFGVGWNVFFGK